MNTKLQKVTQILREKWDPIGEGTIPDLPDDEYKSYAPRIVELMGAEQDELILFGSLVAYLTWVRITQMELVYPSTKREIEAALTLVRQRELLC